MDNESILEIDELGNKFWKNKLGQFHRLDGPAVDWRSGTREWYVFGERHRLDGPAIEYDDGSRVWYKKGILHRLDGPASIDVIYGSMCWVKNGYIHRIDGPAFKDKHGRKEWHIYGVQFANKEDFFESLTEEEKKIALFSEDFING